jgi:hypothetical protein
MNKKVVILSHLIFLLTDLLVVMLFFVFDINTSFAKIIYLLLLLQIPVIYGLTINKEYTPILKQLKQKTIIRSVSLIILTLFIVLSAFYFDILKGNEILICSIGTILIGVSFINLGKNIIKISDQFVIQ